MDPKIRNPQRKMMALEEERKKAIKAPTMSSSPRTPGKLSVFAHFIVMGRVIDFIFLEKEGFTIREKIEAHG